MIHWNFISKTLWHIWKSKPSQRSTWQSRSGAWPIRVEELVDLGASTNGRQGEERQRFRWHNNYHSHQKIIYKPFIGGGHRRRRRRLLDSETPELHAAYIAELCPTIGRRWTRWVLDLNQRRSQHVLGSGSSVEGWLYSDWTAVPRCSFRVIWERLLATWAVASAVESETVSNITPFKWSRPKNRVVPRRIPKIRRLIFGLS